MEVISWPFLSRERGNISKAPRVVRVVLNCNLSRITAEGTPQPPAPADRQFKPTGKAVVNLDLVGSAEFLRIQLHVLRDFKVQSVRPRAFKTKGHIKSL